MDVLLFVCVLLSGLLLFFFFKQKTAYEMRISDWSSDVCSSDLIGAHAIGFGLPLLIALLPASALLAQDSARVETLAAGIAIAVPALASLAVLSAALTANPKGGSAIGGLLEIGRAAWRGRGCQYVLVSGVARSLKKKKTKQ